MNELAALKEATLYSWAQLGLVDFGVRLGGLWLFFFLLLGGPIAAASFEPSRVSCIRIAKPSSLNRFVTAEQFIYKLSQDEVACFNLHLLQWSIRHNFKQMAIPAIQKFT